MNKIIKPTFQQAFTEWQQTTGEKCSFKSWIKPKFNFWKLKFEYYFYYEPVNIVKDGIEKGFMTIFLN